MKKLLLMATALLFACTADLFAQITWHGNGTKNNPYLIESEENIKKLVYPTGGKYYRQTVDLDFTGGMP